MKEFSKNVLLCTRWVRGKTFAALCDPKTLQIQVLIFTLVVLVCQTVAFGQGAIIGILEDVPGVNPAVSHSHGLRIVFQKEGIDWRAFPTTSPEEGCLKTLPSRYPREINWTVAFDGRSLGQVTGRTPDEFRSYSEVGLQEVTSRGGVPTVGKRAAEYGGFTDAVVYRPLVAISKPNFRDPDGWRPLPAPSANLANRLRLGFRHKFPKLCKAMKHDPSKLVPFPYTDEAVEMRKAYSSKTGWSIARLHLEGAIDCSDVDTGFELDDPWFAVNSQTSPQYLDSGMWLVDAGDYDGDGKSELVFSISRYNRGGYEVFYDDFKNHATFEFLYH